jgi:hypothetical protein
MCPSTHLCRLLWSTLIFSIPFPSKVRQRRHFCSHPEQL